MSEPESECENKLPIVNNYSNRGLQKMNLQLRLFEMLVVIGMVIFLVGGGMLMGLSLSLRSSEPLIQAAPMAPKKFELETGTLGVDTLKVDPLKVKLLLDSKPLKIVIKNDDGQILKEKEIKIIHEDVVLGEVDETIKVKGHLPITREGFEDADLRRTTESLPPPKSSSIAGRK